MINDYDDPFGDEQPVQQSRGNGNGFTPPAAQTQLGTRYNQFFVKAYMADGSAKAFCEDYRDIDKACSRAAFLHFKEGYGTRVIAVNTETGIAAELRWRDKDTGYAVHSGQ